MVTKEIKNTKGITLISLIVTIVVLLILAGVSLSVLRGENGILVQTKSARIKTELSKFIEEGGFAYSELYAERVNNLEVVILESDIIAKLISNYGYEGRIIEITDGVPTSITIGNITEDLIANGEKVVVGVQKVGGNSTYYVEILGKYYPIHFNNLEISVKEEEGQEKAGKTDNTNFTAVSDNEEIVIATAQNTNGVLTIELEGKSRGTANVTVTYGTLEAKTINVNVKGKTRIIVEAEIDSETGTAKGTITSPTELDKEYIDGEKITLTAEPASSYKLSGWYIGDTKITLDENNQYTVPNNLVGDVTIVAKFKGTEPTDIFVSFEESTGTLRFYNSEHTDEQSYIVGELYKDNNGNSKNFKNTGFNNYSMPWKNYRESINKVVFVDEIVPINTSDMFYYFTSLAEIENIEKLDTSKVTTMQNMFVHCRSLREIDLSGFDTSNVTSMMQMFFCCKNLLELDLSSFDTSKVTTMQNMFSGCDRLTNIEISNFNTSNVREMNSMFAYCKNLTEIDVSNFDTSKVTNLSLMFIDCEKLTNIDVSNFDTSNVTQMSNMFGGCSSLQEIDVSGFDTSKSTTISCMFYNCSSLAEIDVINFDTSKVTNMNSMFSGCNSLLLVDVSNFNTSNVTEMAGMFKNCRSLANIDVTRFNTSNVTNMSNMFSGCINLTNLDVTKFNTSNVTNMSNMFASCSNLTELDLSNFDTSQVTTMESMFSGCREISQLNVSEFDTLKVTTMKNMFCDCGNLSSINVSNFDTSNVTNMYCMFEHCRNLTILDLGNFNTSKVTTMKNMFYYCDSLSSINVSNFNTSNVTDMTHMFSNCSCLTELDISSFNTSNVTSMQYMFFNSYNLKTIYVNNFSKAKLTDTNSSRDMFGICKSLVGGNGTVYDKNKVDKTYARVDSSNYPGYFTHISQKPTE